MFTTYSIIHKRYSLDDIDPPLLVFCFYLNEYEFRREFRPDSESLIFDANAPDNRPAILVTFLKRIYIIYIFNQLELPGFNRGDSQKVCPV